MAGDVCNGMGLGRHMSVQHDRPILFSAPMVRAILSGDKTQTRRIVKPRRCSDYGCELAAGEMACEPPESLARLCPYGAPGSLLWVRETWAAPHQFDHLPPRLIEDTARIHYAADEPRGGLMWRRSFHMPRAFSCDRGYWRFLPWRTAATAGITTFMPLPPIPDENQPSSIEPSDGDLPCDACGAVIDGEPQHFSGFLNGAETGHIHMCARCAAPLPRIVVQDGVALPDSPQS